MLAEAVVEKRRLNLPLVFLLNVLLAGHLLVYLLGSFPDFDAGARLELWIGVGGALGFAAVSARWMRAAPARLAERWHMPLAAAAAGFLLFLALIPVPYSTYPMLAHAHTLLTFALTFWVFYGLLFDASQHVRARRLWLILGIAGFLVVSLIRLLGLSYYPFVDVQDEPWTTAWAVNWIRTGRLGDPTLGGLGDAYYAYPRFYWLMGLWIRLVGVGLWQERLLGFLLIIPVIGLTAYVARRWYGRAGALFTGVFMFASAVLMSAARVRHDIGLAMCLAASLAAFAVATKRNSPFLHFFAGFIMVCGMFSHYHGAGLSIAMWVGLYAPRYFAQWRKPRSRQFWVPEAGAWLYAGGAGLGGLAVLGIQMLPDDLPNWLWSLSKYSLYSDTTREFFISLFGNIFNIGFFSVFEFVLVAASVVSALRRRTLLDVSLLLVLALGLLALAEMGSGAIYYYILPLVPVYGLLVGRMFVGARLPQVGVSRRQVASFALLLIPLLGASTGRSLQAVMNREPLEPALPAAVAWVRANVPTSAKVVADMYYYFWLNDYDFVSHLVPENLYPWNFERFKTLAEVWNAVDMDYLVIDPNLERSNRRYFQPLLATGLIAQKYEVAATIPTVNGDVIIYQRRPAASGG